VSPRTLLAVLLPLAAQGSLPAAPPPPADELSKAYLQAGRDVAEGKDRQAVLDTLTDAIRAHPKSSWRRYAEPLATDLKWSLEHPPKADGRPAPRLRVSRIYLWVVRYDHNWDGRLKSWLAEAGDDPAAQLLKADRAVIGDLIPILRDRSPTRSFTDHGVFATFSVENVPVVPRACDVALAIIEYHSQCRFFNDPSNPRQFHELSDDAREKCARRVEEWWKDSRGKSVTAGIRAQLPHGTFYEQVWMAKRLVRLGVGQPTDDKEFGSEFLRKMLREKDGHLASHVAGQLAELGDYTARDLFSNRLQQALTGTGPGGYADLMFLMSHGGRREWELLTQAAGRWRRHYLAPFTTHGMAYTNPYAIPGLALALDQTSQTGARYVAGKTVPWSPADTAAEALQKQTGKDFGFAPEGTDADRLAAIERARKWWADEGSKKYTFDYIEKKLAKKTQPKK
jgi:hypothetical protein